jgi:hypothetical protein
MKLCYGGDRFLAISGSGTNWVSMDGLSWRAISRFPGGAVDALTFGAGMFVASDPSGRLYSSKDGVLWVENNSITQNRVRALAFIDGAFFAVGNNHSIFRSGQYLPRLNIGRRMGGDVEVEIGSDPAVPAVVEFSEDLVNWEALSSPPAGVDGTKAVYSENASSPRRFFRVRQ